MTQTNNKEHTVGAPSFIYGTAWKEENTAHLTQQAISAGFRAIDTANQKKHYREDFVGEALVELAQQGIITRTDLFLQTKFTYVYGQDHRLPYDPNADLTTQVKSSFTNSLKNLHTDYMDSFLLHGPISGSGLQQQDWEVWTAIEDLHRKGLAKSIGVSNVNFQQIRELTEKASLKPMSVQNRCFAIRGWDRQVREFCLAHNIMYQGFSLLTANPQVLAHSRVRAIADRKNLTPAQVVFRFCKQIGMVPITGTTDAIHMKEDLQIERFELSENEVQEIQAVSTGGQ